jgi:hypothetical protein
LNFGVVVKESKSIPAKAECVKSRSNTHGESVVSMSSGLTLTGRDLEDEAMIMKFYVAKVCPSSDIEGHASRPPCAQQLQYTCDGDVVTTRLFIRVLNFSCEKR